MGFYSKDDDLRWVDSDDLKWTPDTPLVYAPEATAEAAGDFVPARTVDEPAAPVAAAPAKPANRAWLPRAAIGLAQGAALFALLQSRSLNQWPGNDGYLFTALSLALLFAPLTLLEALGEIPLKLAALWAGIVAATLACLGLYHHWRIQDGDPPHAGLALTVLIALALVIAQALLRAGVRDRKIIASYRTCFDITWTLAARLLIWAAVTACAWTVLGLIGSVMNWLRTQYPGLHTPFDPALLVMPLVGVASGFGFALTAGTSGTRRFTRKMLLACFTIALPVMTAIGAIMLVTHLLMTALPLWALLTSATLLLLAFNASYRSGTRRARWRRVAEAAAAVVMLLLCLCAAFALHTRIAAAGWTDTRIEAAVAIAVLGAYALAYCCAGLIAVGGGRWMQRIEPANRALACITLAVALLLCTPLADPLRLAVNAQAHRLAAGADPATFDFTWLKREGVRFGRQALTRMQTSRSAEVARDAAITLATPPGTDTPPASQLGANITVRTPGARLPNSLLDRDWARAPGAVPPCLTRARMLCDAWFLDLDHDGAPEILLVYGSDARWWASVMKADWHGVWNPVASFASPDCRGTLTAMRKGNMVMVDPAPTWQDLFVAGFRLTAQPGVKPDLPCPK